MQENKPEAWAMWNKPLHQNHDWTSGTHINLHVEVHWQWKDVPEMFTKSLSINYR